MNAVDVSSKKKKLNRFFAFVLKVTFLKNESGQHAGGVGEGKAQSGY